MPIEAWALALGSASLFGLGLVVTQFGLRDMTPALGATFSMPMAALVFWSSAPFLADFSGWDGDAVLLFAVVGIFFPGMITLLTFEANRRMGPYVSGAIGNLAPLFAVVAALVVLGEALDILQWLAVVAILGGVTSMSLRRQWEGGSWRRWVIVLPLGAALCRGARAARAEDRPRLVAEPVRCGAYLLRDVGIGCDCRRPVADAGDQAHRHPEGRRRLCRCRFVQRICSDVLGAVAGARSGLAHVAGGRVLSGLYADLRRHIAATDNDRPKPGSRRFIDRAGRGSADSRISSVAVRRRSIRRRSACRFRATDVCASLEYRRSSSRNRSGYYARTHENCPAASCR